MSTPALEAAIGTAIFGTLAMLVVLMLVEAREERLRNMLLGAAQIAVLKRGMEHGQEGEHKGKAFVRGLFASKPSAKFGSASQLITGKPQEAVKGIFYYMRVADPMGADGIERRESERPHAIRP